MRCWAALPAITLTFWVHDALGSFSLLTGGPDWDASNNIAPTTSQACSEAYGATIECDETFLAIAGTTLRSDFDPDAGDLAQACSSTCKSSLDSYVQGVKEACTAAGDRAEVAISSQATAPNAPVWVYGEIFQWKYLEACATNRRVTALEREPISFQVFANVAAARDTVT